MTLMQDRLAMEILKPENKTLKEAGRKAGYEVEHSRCIYKPGTKRYISKLLDGVISKETMTKYFQALSELAIKEKDLSNANRSGENIAKLSNLLKDNNIQQAVINIQDTLDQLRVDKPIDAST